MSIKSWVCYGGMLPWEKIEKRRILKRSCDCGSLYHTNNLHPSPPSKNIKPDLDDLENGPDEGNKPGIPVKNGKIQ